MAEEAETEIERSELQIRQGRAQRARQSELQVPRERGGCSGRARRQR